MKRIANMTANELNALTREELISHIRELEPPPPNDWHSWMDALLHIVLHFYPVSIEREFVLGSQAPRADFLILKKDRMLDLGLRIFKIFRESNIIEFKGPDDELNEGVLWKCIGYVGFYISLMGISADQVTLTLIRATKTAGLFKELSEYIVPDEVNGIYYITNWRVDLPIQILVTTELTGPEYAGFRAISKQPKLQDIIQMFRNNEQETDPSLTDFYKAYWTISARLTGNALEEAKRRDPKMAKTLMDILKPEIDERIDASTRNNLYLYVQDGDMSLDRAAKRAGMSLVDFVSDMEKAGYNVPKMA